MSDNCDRCKELEAKLAKQNVLDPELMKKVADYVSSDHWLVVDMDDGTS